jgi:serine/threonine protein kinase
MVLSLQGLAYLHSKHVVHFDLKSANLLFTIRYDACHAAALFCCIVLRLV